MVQKGNLYKRLWRQAESGQALVEYALILVLVAVALAAALIATGPALGNVFSNTVYNLLGQEGTPIDDLSLRGGPEAFWETVTAVAMNPPTDREFPPNPPKPPKPSDTPGPSPTPTPDTPTVTPSFTPTVTISPTPADIAHIAPFDDPIDHPEWWRVDSSVWLGGDDWLGTYFANRNLTPPALERKYYNGELDARYRFNIAFDWGNGSPLQGWSTDNFSIRWTRHVYVEGPNPLPLQFSILSDDGVRLCVDKPAPNRACSDAGGTTVINNWTGRTFGDGPLNGNITLSPGDHWLTVEYYDDTSAAGIFLDISNFRGNVLTDRAIPSGAANCQWARVTGSQPNTVAWAWEESPLAGNGFPPNMNCSLELRGFVDVTSLAAPELSFWDVWDFGATTTVTVYVAEYQPYNADGTGGPNWGTGTVLHTGSTTRNYAWTRLTVPIPDVVSKKITYRFTIQSGSGTGVRRFYLDDIQVKDPTTRTYGVCSGSITTCSTYWSMDDAAHKDDFITSGRWSTTANNTADNSPLSWDSSATSGGKYVRFGPEQGTTVAGDFRIHSIEFNGTINVPYNLDGSGGTPDFEGDDGPPKLTFYHAYDLDLGESIEIQWTRDARDGIPDNWQTLKVLANASSTTANQVMDLAEVPLNTITDWNTSPFRLRFAFKVNKNNTTKNGWWIDNIVIDREGVQRYASYPFCDNAEDGPEKWLLTGQWGFASTGAFGSSRSFTDSPFGTYLAGQESAMETRRLFDFNNDSLENLAVFGGNKDCAGAPSGAAVRPILTFWHNRAVLSNHAITVDVYRSPRAAAGAIPATTEIAWTPIWRYDFASRTRTQVAWERVEVNMQAAIEQVTTLSWLALTTNNNPYDDDFYFRIRLDTRSGTGRADGVYVDDVRLGNYSEVTHKLWDQTDSFTFPATEPAGGLGSGPRYVDDIDNPVEWWERWQLGGEWTAIEWDQHGGLRSLHDHATEGQTYKDKQYSVLEMNRIIDLRGASRADQPTLYFWNHYNTGNDDLLLVQIAVEDSTRTRQGYNYVHGWGTATSYGSSFLTSWETVWQIGGQKRVDTWIREQVDLTRFADDPATGANEGRRVRIRFVLDTYDTSSGLSDGWWLDDIVVQNRQPRIIGLTFYDAAQNLSNWIAEGTWGIAPDLWRGAGGGPAALGTEDWHAYYFDCINWMTDFSGPPTGQIKTTLPSGGGTTRSCTTANTNAFFNAIPRTKAGTDAWLNVTGRATNWRNVNTRFLGGTVPNINHDYGSTGRPSGAPTGSAGNTWDNDYMARWFRHITVLAGEYTFITTSDDAVRLRYDAVNAPPGWNIIENWTTHGRTTNFNTVTLAAGEYDLILEWFESTSSAVIILQVGNNNFSFSDSPKSGAADTIPAVPSVAYGNSSLILNGLLNLFNPGVAAALWTPRLEYYTYYQLPSNTTARAEVSSDGGFSWTTANLSNNCPSGVQCNPIISGSTTWLPANGDWQLRRHDLRAYANRNIGLRFRLNTLSSVLDGWWITDIQVNN